MEVMIMSRLKWILQFSTPYSYIDYFLNKINDNYHFLSSATSKTIQLILTTIKNIHFLEFRPSEVAAAVAISVSVEMQMQSLDIDDIVSEFIFVDKDKVVKCVELIKDLLLRSEFGAKTPTSYNLQSPKMVLDAGACLSCKINAMAVGSSAKSSQSTSPDEPKPKRERHDH